MASKLYWFVAVVILVGDAAPQAAEPPEARTLAERHQKEKAPVWVDGDAVTFYYRGEAEQVEVMFAGSIQPLRRVPGSDAWTLSVKLPALERAVFSYRFVAKKKHPSVRQSPEDSAVWRGPKAPAAAEECANLLGRLEELEVESKALGGKRKVTVYLPPGHGPKKASRVVYAADGEAIPRFARVLEPLIAAGRVPPVVLIGVHNGGYAGGAPDIKHYDPQKDLRLQEYLPGVNTKRFAEHERFFSAEVPAWAERRFGVSSARADRAVFGYSNGGRFAVEMGLRHPDVFGHVFGFSVAGDGEFEFGPGRKDLPRFHLEAGTWEESFHGCTASLADQLKRRGASVHFTSRVGGHDTALWRDEFAAALVRAFGKE
jgi:enterochelin esterase-like enzyme